MTKRQKSIRTQITLSGISSVRRHVYFYLLLFLTTAVLHSAWKCTPPDAALEAIAAGEKAADVQRELAAAESQFAP
jgi:hypothetical protein